MAQNLTRSEADFVPWILLVEDSDDDAFFFQRAIKKTGLRYSVRRASNGRIAIETIGNALKSSSPVETLPHVIFLDLKMPVTSGFEVLQWLKASGINLPLGVIVLSGSDDHADRLRAKTLGACDYLVKPIRPEDLKERLQNATEAKRESIQTRSEVKHDS